MEIKNRVYKGLHQDNSVYAQPQDTMVDNRNGIVTNMENGNYKWTNIKGDTLYFSLSSHDDFMAHCMIRDRLIIMFKTGSDDYIVISELIFDTFTGNYKERKTLWVGSSNLLNMSPNNPIKAMFGYYENGEIQRVYWTDFLNQPRSVKTIEGIYNQTDEKFVDFFPQIDNCYGTFSLPIIQPGGNCLAGSYIFAWRLYKEDYYTDWSYTTFPVCVIPYITPSASDKQDYMNTEGAAPNENTNTSIKFLLQSLDTDYDGIQVCSFYSNDLNSAQPGKVIYDGDITASSMYITYEGTENYGTVTIDEVIETSIVIDKCFDMVHMKGVNILARIEEREEIDLSSVHSTGRNDQMEVTIVPFTHPVFLSSTAYEDMSGVASPLNAVYTSENEVSINELIKDIYYYAVTEVTFTDNTTARTIPAGNVFFLYYSEFASITTGTVTMVIVKRKYKPQSSGLEINDFELEITQLTDRFYNYKDSLFSNLLRSYPSEEVIRLGIVFFDKTGRPYFARHLYNTQVSWSGYTIGPGDTVIPPHEPGGEFHTHDYYINGSDEFIIGKAIGLRISGIDITDIRNKIGGFSIVRAPIKRRIAAYGVLSHLIDDSNNISLKPTFSAYSSDTNVWDKGYAFICPEDLFELSGFSIQPGDNVENAYYQRPFNPTEDTGATLTGIGYKESTNGYYQLFAANPTGTPTGNGVIGVSHEISSYTKYKLGDQFGTATADGMTFDPSAPQKLFFEKTKPINTDYYSYATFFSILTFNELDGEGTDIKGMHNLAVADQKLLMCKLIKNIQNSYGGDGEFALANTTYISIGHYQPVNDSILSDIFNGSRYVFNYVEVFGGDSFINIFDINRLLLNQDISENNYNHSILVPIESRVNLDLREGNHISKNKTGGNIPLQRLANEDRWEEFNYNDGYSTDNINDYYISLPSNFKNQNQFDNRIRYSLNKTNGELRDSFKRFNALSYIDLDTDGPIINIKPNLNNLLYWQPDLIGYIPMNERALSTNQFGQPVQLGVGGIFERYDNIINKLGNSNHFGLVESIIGFHWYDAKRKVLVTLTRSMKFEQDSIVKGLDNFFTNILLNDFEIRDNPTQGSGITGGVDELNKIIYFTFISYDKSYYTIGLDYKTNRFIGFFDFPVKFYIPYKKNLLMQKISNGHSFYRYMSGIPGKYFGSTKTSYFSIIVKEDSNVAKIFDRFEYLGSETTFTSIKYENSKQLITEILSNNKNYKFRNKRWMGTFPKVNRERLVDGYLKITFIYSGTEEISFDELKTEVRNMI